MKLGIPATFFSYICFGKFAFYVLATHSTSHILKRGFAFIALQS